MADLEELGLCGSTPSKAARKKHHVERIDDRSKKQRRHSHSASSSSYSFSAVQAERARAQQEQERLKTAQAEELRKQQESAQRRERELLAKQKELQKQLMQKSSSSSSSSLEPADMAYESLPSLCLQQVIQRNSILEAASLPSATATEWKFQDIGGTMIPVHAYITPVLDEFDNLFKGATDTFNAPDSSDVSLLKQMLQSGEIVPLYNGFDFFEGLYRMQDDNLYKVDKSGITGSVAASPVQRLLIDGFNGFPLDEFPTLLGGIDEGLNRLIWCYQLDFAKAGSKPCVISAEKRFQHPYLLMFDYEPASSLCFFAIPHANNLYMCRVERPDTGTTAESAAQVGAFY